MRVALLVVAACTTSVPGVAEQSGRCTALEGRSFASLVEMECGLGPNGPVPCTWHLTFDAHDATTSLLYWQHSDTGVEAPVACMGPKVDVTPPAYNGTYDEATLTLTWAGADYR